MKTPKQNEMLKLQLTRLAHKPSFQCSHDQDLLSAHQVPARHSSDRTSRLVPGE